MKKILAIIACSVCCDFIAAQQTYTLEQIKDSALRNNFAIRNAKYSIEAAQQLRQNDIQSQRLKLQNGISIVRLLLSQYCGLRDTSFVISYQSKAPSAILSCQDHDQALQGTAEYQNKLLEYRQASGQ